MMYYVVSQSQSLPAASKTSETSAIMGCLLHRINLDTSRTRHPLHRLSLQTVVIKALINSNNSVPVPQAFSLAGGSSGCRSREDVGSTTQHSVSLMQRLSCDEQLLHDVARTENSIDGCKAIQPHVWRLCLISLHSLRSAWQRSLGRSCAVSAGRVRWI